MKHKAQARQSSAKDVKRETFDIIVDDPKLLELEKLIDQRKRVTKKIRNLPKLEERLKIESPEVTLQELFERLQKKKSSIDKAIAKHDDLKRPNPRPPFSAMVMERCGPMTIEEVLARQQHRVHTDWSDILQQSTCPTINGRATPYLSSVGTQWSGSELNHNSTANYYYLPSSYSMGELVWNIAAWLNDDASIWRDDDPDIVAWFDCVGIYLPTVECDSKIVASLSMIFSGHICSEADDHNEIRHYVFVAHSDQDGNLPPHVSFGEKYSLNNIDLSGEIGLPEGSEGPIIDSGWVTANMSFNVKSNATPKVAAATWTELRAQDGTLKIAGDWRITDLVYSIAPT